MQQIPLTAIPIGPLGVTARKLYRRFNLAGAFYLVATLADNTQTTCTDTLANSARGAAYTGANTAIGNRIDVLTIPVWRAAAVTARELYMSPAGGGPRKLALTLPDNITTTRPRSPPPMRRWPAAAANPSPTPAACSSPSARSTPAPPPCRWPRPRRSGLPVAGSLLGGGQVVRYTGISGQVLIGIPANGPGAITTTVLYGQQACPRRCCWV